MRELTPAEAAAPEMSPEDAVTNGWLDSPTTYLTVPLDDGEPERIDQPPRV